jgi:hypothetical protein
LGGESVLLAASGQPEQTINDRGGAHQEGDRTPVRIEGDDEAIVESWTAAADARVRGPPPLPGDGAEAEQRAQAAADEIGAADKPEAADSCAREW